MILNTIKIPYTAKRENESNEETFCRVMETYTGQFEDSWGEFTFADLGEWVNDSAADRNEKYFPCAWIENDDGYMTEYFVFFEVSGEWVMKHETIEY